MENIITGIFQKECSGRFLCEVQVEGKNIYCYVGSSAKLENFIDLKNKEVYLSNHKSQSSKTKYALYALEEKKGNIILLNLNKVNLILRNYLIVKGALEEKIRMEVSFQNGLKADIVYYSEYTTIFEAKTILARETIAVFPSTKTKRVKSQLLNFIEMLSQGYKIEYCFFILSLHIKKVEINREENEIERLFTKAVSMGMKVNVFRSIWNGNEFYPEFDEEVTGMLLKSLGELEVI